MQGTPFGPLFDPTAKVGTQWGKVTLGDGQVVHCLSVLGPTGITAMCFDDDALAAFIRTAQEQLTGLVLPVPKLDLPNHPG